MVKPEARVRHGLLRNTREHPPFVIHGLLEILLHYSFGQLGDVRLTTFPCVFAARIVGLQRRGRGVGGWAAAWVGYFGGISSVSKLSEARVTRNSSRREGRN